MNNLSSSTLIGWETRSAKRHSKAVNNCKDYGLRPLFKTLYIGKLNTREKRSIQLKIKKVLYKKTDKIFCGVFCESCFCGLDSTAQECVFTPPPFKIIQ